MPKLPKVYRFGINQIIAWEGWECYDEISDNY